MRHILADSAGTILAPNGRPAILESLEGNWYESSRWSPNRSWVWFPVQDARKDLDRFTRLELSKRARYLYKNSPFIRGIAKRYVTLTVGSGFRFTFKSDSPEWNKRAAKVWQRKSRNISLGPRCSFSQYQRAIVLARFIDGECFSVKTADETVSYEHKIQGLEADRIAGTKSKGIAQEASEFVRSPGFVDGLNLNKQGIVLSYNIRDVDEAYDAEFMTHHFTPDRMGQYRGETVLAAAINTATDVDDILALEKTAVKDASSHTDIIETASGELDPEQFRKLRYTSQYPTTFNLPADPGTHDDYYKVTFGTAPVVLKRGDKYTSYKSDRPGGAWQGFMEFLSNTICCSTGYPPSVFLPIDVGGTDIRRDLDIAQKVSDPVQLDICMELDELVDHLLADEVQDGELRKDLPDDWNVRAWHFPPKVNVDRQTAQQDRQDYQAGLMSADEYHGRYGDDGDEYENVVITEVQRRRDKIKQAGFADLKEFVQTLSLNPQLFNQPKPSPDNEPAPKE